MGWVRQYRSRLAHPTVPFGDDFDALIVTGITQIATVGGAIAAFDSTVASASRNAAPVDRPRVIGDQSGLFQLEARMPDGSMHPELRLVFRHGALVCDLIVVGAAGETLLAADIEALAERQIERIDRVLAGDAPGLSLKVLRWRGLGINDPDLDNYLKLDGTMYAVLGDDESDIAISAENYQDATDYYRYEAALTESLFQFTSVVQFPTDDVAAAWVRDAYARTDRNRTADTTLEQVTPAPSLGDESVVLKATTPVEGGTAYAYAVFFQVGDQAVGLAIISLSDLDIANVIAMAADQAACFEAGDCTESAPLPSWIGA
jgi:hypothetical protein